MNEVEHTGRTIAKNASVLMASQVITWGLTILLTIFLPRYLGVSAVGQFHLANSLWAIGAILASFGMDLLVTKEIARDAGRTLRACKHQYSHQVAVIRHRLPGYWDLYPHRRLPNRHRPGDLYRRDCQLVREITSAFEAAIKGLERMEFISLANIITKAIITRAPSWCCCWGTGL